MGICLAIIASCIAGYYFFADSTIGHIFGIVGIFFTLVLLFALASSYYGKPIPNKTCAMPLFDFVLESYPQIRWVVCRKPRTWIEYDDKMGGLSKISIGFLECANCDGILEIRLRPSGTAIISCPFCGMTTTVKNFKAVRELANQHMYEFARGKYRKYVQQLQ